MRSLRCAAALSLTAVVVAVAPAQAEVYLGNEVQPQSRFLRGSDPASAPATTRAEPPLTATPRATCGPGSRPAPGLQGQVVAGEGSAQGYTCNTTQLGHEGASGGFKVERFVDKAGHQCAYYDQTLLFPVQAFADKPTPGVAVLDMTDPAHPVRTATLVTPAMQTPHESVLVNQKRGLLAAVMGNPTLYPGFVDIYDLNADCRQPELQSSLPVGLLGHESGFAPDGNTFYATSLFTSTVTAVDVTNPKVPVTLWVGQYPSHGFSVSDDGNRGYVAGLTGLIILDISEIQARKPNPQAKVISQLTWKDMTIPQVALPVTIGGKKFLMEVDEFATAKEGDSFPAANGPRVGAARLIDISDEVHPQVVSNMRLEVNQPENRDKVAGDPGASNSLQGYAGHYCNVPQEVDPGIVACSFIASGLRVFDIRDPYKPTELAYFVAPLAPSPGFGEPTNYAMSRPTFDAARGEVWYADGNSGFYAVKLTNGVWPFDTGSDLGLPSANRCRSQRVFTIHLKHPNGDRLRSARVYVDGKRVRIVRGSPHFRARIDLRGKRKKTIVVRVVAKTRSGKTVRETRRYHTCTPGHPT